MASQEYHEREETLNPQTRDLHRGIASLQEELEGFDRYRQRADSTGDADLKAVLLRSAEERIERASMLLEWLRRHEPLFDEKLRTYLFRNA